MKRKETDAETEENTDSQEPDTSGRGQQRKETDTRTKKNRGQIQK